MTLGFDRPTGPSVDTSPLTTCRSQCLISPSVRHRERVLARGAVQRTGPTGQQFSSTPARFVERSARWAGRQPVRPGKSRTAPTPGRPTQRTLCLPATTICLSQWLAATPDRKLVDGSKRSTIHLDTHAVCPRLEPSIIKSQPGNDWQRFGQGE